MKTWFIVTLTVVAVVIAVVGLVYGRFAIGVWKTKRLLNKK